MEGCGHRRACLQRDIAEVFGTQRGCPYGYLTRLGWPCLIRCAHASCACHFSRIREHDQIARHVDTQLDAVGNRSPVGSGSQGHGPL